MNFHERLRSLVKESGTAQNVIAAACGMSPGALSQYLSGNVPKTDQLLSLARYFGVTAEWLFTGEGVKTVYEAWLQESSKEASAILQEPGNETAKESSKDLTLKQLEFDLGKMKKRAEQAETLLAEIRGQQLSFWAKLDPQIETRLNIASEKLQESKSKRTKS